MNKLQRNSISRSLSIFASGTFCCHSFERAELPEELVIAAHTGDVERIKDYIAKDHDVNATHRGETLLSRACGTNQVDVVALLLQCPDVHLNIPFQGYTPLARASCHGHIKCVQMILESSLKCVPELESGWVTIKDILRRQPSLSQRSLLHILNWAVHETQWEVVELILLRNDLHIPERNLYLLAMQAVSLDRWDVLERALKRKFNGKDEVLAEILGIIVQRRCWEKVQDVLNMLDKGLKMEVELVEAALDEDLDEVEKLLRGSNYDPQVLNGCLLVVSAGGTNDSVAKTMLGLRNTYTKKTFTTALFLMMHYQNAEFFLPLLCHPEASYSYHDISHARWVLEMECKNNSIYFFSDSTNQPLLSYLDRLIEAKVCMPKKS